MATGRCWALMNDEAGACEATTLLARGRRRFNGRCLQRVRLQLQLCKCGCVRTDRSSLLADFAACGRIRRCLQVCYQLIGRHGEGEDTDEEDREPSQPAGLLHFDGRVVDDDGRPLLESDDGEG
ncbi:hypothetical protein ZIOFF_000758 [Zingiber officinale]|uniref:Uncharacterized protein n=1 Tax=Zingiber officinale TaxID=94328 RepID=A0A8J5I8Q3_ZINOF|nr:hypothetical protein ZIOFF_000758 [Zingiber officinale]